MGLASNSASGNSGGDLNSFLGSPTGAGGALASIAAKVHPDQQQREREHPLFTSPAGGTNGPTFYPSQNQQSGMMDSPCVETGGALNSAQSTTQGKGPNAER